MDLEFLLSQAHVPNIGGHWLEVNSEHSGRSLNLWQWEYHYCLEANLDKIKSINIQVYVIFSKNNISSGHI